MEREIKQNQTPVITRNTNQTRRDVRSTTVAWSVGAPPGANNEKHASPAVPREKFRNSRPYRFAAITDAHD